ncbi:MAG: NAD-dependent epimerase/dehydratase family protein [Candidatus Acidiferrales bacterium]
MKILITGGCGFVGAHLALHFQRRGHRVIAADNLVRRGGEMNLPRFKKHGIEFVHVDVRNPEDLASVPEGIDLICDTSAQPSAVTGYANPLFDINNNSLGLIHVLEFARKRGCPVIFWSTNRVYSADKTNSPPHRAGSTRLIWDKEKYRQQFGEKPLAGFDPEHGFSEEFTLDGCERTIYGLSKLMADLACQEYSGAFGLKTVINRFGVISGDGQFGKSDQGWVAWWAFAFHFGLPLNYIGWEGKQVRDVLFIEDVCRLVDLQIENLDRISGQVFNVGGGPGNTLSLVEATNLLREKLGRDIPIGYDSQPRKADQCIYITDNRKVERVLGWKPKIGISEGYDRILAWIRENEEELRLLYATTEEKNKAVR